MKIKIIFFALALAMALTFPTFAQYNPARDTVHKPDVKQHDTLSKMSKPTFEASSGDLLFSIWITTQEEHKKMMSEMSEKGMGIDMGSMNDKDKGMDNDMNMKGMKDMGMKKDSNSMKHKEMRMESTTKEAMMAGTHHMMVDVKDKTSRKATIASSAKVDIVSPTNKNSSVDLKMPMANHFGSGLTLDEKGVYQLKVSVLVGNVFKTFKLKYKVM
jgi:hypothetical protein